MPAVPVSHIGNGSRSRLDWVATEWPSIRIWWNVLGSRTNTTVSSGLSGGLKQRDPKQYDRLEFRPGEEAQVDYGTGAPTLHRNGRYRRPRLFVMTLEY